MHDATNANAAWQDVRQRLGPLAVHHAISEDKSVLHKKSYGR